MKRRSVLMLVLVGTSVGVAFTLARAGSADGIPQPFPSQMIHAGYYYWNIIPVGADGPGWSAGAPFLGAPFHGTEKGWEGKPAEEL